MKNGKNYLTGIFITGILCSGFSFADKIKKESVKQTEKRLSELYASIPSGTLKTGQTYFDIPAFNMGITEVTNAEFKAFLDDLKTKEQLDKYHRYFPDTTCWNVQPMQTHYFSHPAFGNYPVVNITKEAAIAYTNWLTEKNKEISENQKIIFRLPSKAEWIYAAKGNDENAVYTWKAPYLRGRNGHLLANFMHVPNGSLTKGEDGLPVFVKNALAESPYEYNQYTSVVRSYGASDWGIYNMNGNVAEMLLDSDEVIGGSWNDYGYDIRNESTQKHNGQPLPTIGFRVVMLKQ